MKKYNAPRVKESKGIQILTTIWLVPLLAMIIALWLAFQYYAKIGPTIQISFKSNAGLIANQSQIKLRDVTIGMVTKISLSDDGTGVTVEARMNKEVSSYLNDRAKMWIVHPDVGSHGVSGLDTLLSGSYIELHGIKKLGTQQRKFIGLEDPYIDSEAKGKYYHLSAPTSNDITEGSNVYYRKIKVGRVERVGLSMDGTQVNFTVFVQDRYTPFINTKSLFYTRSNFSMDFSQGKLDISIASLSQIVHGGISIYTPTQSIKDINQSNLNEKEVYPLYSSLAEMKSKHLMTGADDKVYQFKFKDNINKLEISSPIEFNGFQVGYVIDIESHFDEQNQSVQSNIFAIIHTKAFSNPQTAIRGEEVLEKLVHDGLKATLNTAVPIIGGQFIDLIFDNTTPATIVNNDTYALFPTSQQKKSDGMVKEIEKLIVKLEKLPLENLLTSATKLIDDTNVPVKSLLIDLDKSIKNLNTLTSNKSLHKLPEDLSNTVQELRKTLNQFQNFTQGYDADSKFSAELSVTLKELSLAAESIERVGRKLEKKPNALLLGDD